jgi:Fe-S cluster assembly ATP-binding protein
MFLAFQYPVEIPGVANLTFLRTALNALRTHRGEKPLDAVEFIKLSRERGKVLGMDDKLLQRAVNVGFSGGEKKRNEVLQMAVLDPKLAILDETDSARRRCFRIVAEASPVRGPGRAHRRPTTSVC